MNVQWIICIGYISSHWIIAQSCIPFDHPVAHQPGDVMIGGLFPVHKGVSNLIRKSFNERFICESLDLESMTHALSMIFAIETINNSTLLQGIKLGYQIYDTCSDILKAVHLTTMKLIPRPDARNCRYGSTRFHIKAVVGEIYSDVSIPVARLLGNYLIPQVSPGSSASTLNDKVRFPSFLRTVPDDRHQVKAVAGIIKTFQWNWVGMIASDDEYGKSFSKDLNDLLQKESICIHFSETVPSYVFKLDVESILNHAIKVINESNANVLVMAISKLTITKRLLEKCVEHNITKTWIMTDTWFGSKDLFDSDVIDKVGTILGVIVKTQRLKAFEEYLRNLFPLQNDTENIFLQEYQDLRFNCTKKYRAYLECNNSSINCTSYPSPNMKSPLACQEENLTSYNDEFLVKNIEWSVAYTTYLAVLAIAHALQDILCVNGICQNKDFLPSQLLERLNNTSFSFDGQQLQFSPSGNFELGFDVVHLQFGNNSRQFKTVGSYNSTEDSLFLNKSLIQWRTSDNQVPFSNCSRLCTPGFSKKHSNISCCYECVQCAENYFAPDEDMAQCVKCNDSQWSWNGSSYCTERSKEYFEWEDKFAITLVTFAVFGVLVLLISGCLFVINADNPAVKAAGGNYTYLFLVALLLSLASIGLFIGEPNNLICKIRQPLYGISFTIAVSCILIKTLRILLAFESALRGQRVVKLTYQPILTIVILSGVQIFICVMWIFLKGPFFYQIYMDPRVIILSCDEGSYVSFSIMLGYIGLLALVCFLLAFRGRKLPQRYNETRFITFSMLVYMFVWILFIPIYVKTTSGIYPSVIQAVAILASVYGVISCHLLPVCYIIIFKKDSCTREQYMKSIRKFYKAKSDQSNSHKKQEDCPAKSQQHNKTALEPHRCLSYSQMIRRRHKSC